jgi:hypothetical protein
VNKTYIQEELRIKEPMNMSRQRDYDANVAENGDGRRRDMNIVMMSDCNNNVR